jgi:hypothetical protein
MSNDYLEKGLDILAARTDYRDVKKETLSAVMAALARRKAAMITQAQRRELALRMNQARWGKGKAK